jgi:hypothetical protein
MEYKNYDKKDKYTGKQIHQIVEMQDIEGGREAKIATQTFDDKDEEIIAGSFFIQCIDEVFYIDMSNMLPADMTESMQEMEMEIGGEYMEFPKNPSAGQKLPDADMNVAAKMNGTTIMNITVHVTDRMVEGFETITTPAGTFECMRYSESAEVKMIFKVKTKSVSWYAKGVGTVKSESYNDKGKLEGTMLLTSFSK